MAESAENEIEITGILDADRGERVFQDVRTDRLRIEQPDGRQRWIEPTKDGGPTRLPKR